MVGSLDPLMEIPETDSYGVGRFMLASGLVRGIEVRPAGEVNRGPWPWEWRAPAALGAGLTAMAAVALVRGRIRRRATPAPSTTSLETTPV